jgi:hypothetical protein
MLLETVEESGARVRSKVWVTRAVTADVGTHAYSGK